jgi:hypothetical protein
MKKTKTGHEASLWWVALMAIWRRSKAASRMPRNWEPIEKRSSAMLSAVVAIATMSSAWSKQDSISRWQVITSNRPSPVRRPAPVTTVLQPTKKIGCEAFEIATSTLGSEQREWLATWPNEQIVDMQGGSVLLCHGSPGYTTEFLYEAELDDLHLEAWLDKFGLRGFICTHSGLPFVRQLAGGLFAVNGWVVGKADHDGDPAVHYAFIDLSSEGCPVIDIRRITSDYDGWARWKRPA